METEEHIQIQDEESENTNSDVLIISLSSQQNEALSKLHQNGTIQVPRPSCPPPNVVQEDDTPTTTSVVLISLTPQQNAALLQFQQGGTAKFPDFPLNPSTYPRKPADQVVHQCKICKKLFSRSWVLTRHLLTHTGIRPFNCETCGLLFSQKSHLARHQKIHINDEPLKCNYCDKIFPNQREDNLARHERQHRERPFMCEICGKSSYRKDNLQRHQRMHKRPFICGTCYKEFYLKKNLVTHIEEKHMKKRRR